MSSSLNIRENIKENLENFSFKFDENILTNLEQLSYENENIIDEFISFCISKSSNKQLNSEIISEFRSTIINKKYLPKPNIIQNKNSSKLNDTSLSDFSQIYGISPNIKNNEIINQTLILNKTLSTSTPNIDNKHLLSSNIINSTDLELVKNHVKSIVLLNDKIDLFMYQKHYSYISYINKYYVKILELIAPHLMNIDIQNISSSVFEEYEICGRISSINGSNLNLDNICIEIPVFDGLIRIKLNLENINRFSFYPGQIVVFNGKNDTDKCLKVSSFISDIPYKICGDKCEEISGIICIGPYFDNNNPSLDFIDKLRNILVTNSPSLFIFMGPFVDKSVNLKNIFEFIRNMFCNVYDICHENHIELIIIPSIDDICSIPVYPQPCLLIQNIPTNMYPNPCTFKVNGNIITIINYDILFQLSAYEISKGSYEIDRISTLLYHIINSQELYPLYPPHPSCHIDYNLINSLPFHPYLFICTSKLCPFVKQINNTLCINPLKFYNTTQLSYTYFKLVPDDTSRFNIHLSFAEIIKF